MSQLLSTKQLASLLSVAPGLVYKSRMTGVLMGVDAPKHLKMGQTVRYELETVEAWIEQFKQEQDQ